MNGSIQCRLRAGGVAALVLLGFTVPGIASGQTWSGAGGDSNWSTPGNWVGGVAPASGNATIVNFVTAASGFVSTVDAPFTLNRLNLLGTAAYTLGGAAISFDGVAPQLTLGGPYALANDLSFLVTTLIDAQTSQVLTGQVAGPAGLTKAGTGRLTLAGSPLTWGGSTTVSAGTLQIGNGTTGPNFFASPIVVDGEIDFAGTVPGTNVANSLSGTGTVTVSGGTMTGSGPAWTHSGATNITGGTLSATINSPGRLTVTGTGVLQTGDSAFGSLSDGAIPGTGSVFSNATAITVGSDNTSTTFSGTLAGAGGLTKVGAGTFTIGGASMPMTGVLTVNGGRVNLLASGGGGAIVNGGGTLGGTGTISGPVTVNAGGTLAPGLSPGIINTGNLVLAGIFLVEIEGTTLGTQYDNTNVTGTVNVAGATLTLAGAYVPQLGDTFTIIANDGADAVTGTFAGLAEGATLTLNGSTLRITYAGGTGNDVVLVTTAAAAPASAPGVPTLSEWGLLILALLTGGIGMVAASRRLSNRS